eukprot:2059446-Prymnesium_polylepis.1
MVSLKPLRPRPSHTSPHISTRLQPSPAVHSRLQPSQASPAGVQSIVGDDQTPGHSAEAAGQRALPEPDARRKPQATVDHMLSLMVQTHTRKGTPLSRVAAC